MPIRSREDAVEVENRIARIFAAPQDERGAAVRELFVEVLDFKAAYGHIDLAAVPANVSLPDSGERVATLGGVQIVYVALNTKDTDRVRKGEAAAAARRITELLNGDLLLVFTNTSASQLHFVYPSFQQSRPALRRMVVERDLPRRTAIQQVSNIYWHYREIGIIRLALDEAFDVEPVTREFFSEYKRVFDAAEQNITGFGNDTEARRRFVQTLFNRLLFVYFLSRKGWLTFQADSDYLNALWRDHQSTEGDNFYTERLRPLFFHGLNKPNPAVGGNADACLQRLIGNVPFLNGGLFELGEIDGWKTVTVPDTVIQAIFRDLFDRFNFTVMESTPFDVEVAVDPEMLGKVFEELVTGRHDSGAYYTPRPVVSFMCREALKCYLEEQDTGVCAEGIARFVDQRDTSGISSVASARRVAEALDEVTVVDPACGSGAYLLGMMQELVELQTALFNVGVDPRGIYELKLHIIERNLYGVDIDDFAVNIAMLRMWLSLAVEYEGGQPPPLPNLDFKVLCGDSLLGPNPSADAEVQGTLGHDVDRVKLLGRLKADFMRTSLGPDKTRLRQEIRAAEDSVRRALGTAGLRSDTLDWRVEFAEVFTHRRGFDIAIANPPYVRQENIGEHKATLVQQYSRATTPRSDLYCYFYARALDVLREGGMHVFVCSNSWLDVGYGARLQEYLLGSTQIQAIFESAVERQFSTADINTVITLVRKTRPESDAETRFVSLRGQFNSALLDPELRREIKRSRSALMSAGTRGAKYQGDKWGGKYLRAPDIYHHLLDKCADKLVRLGDISTVRRGVTTGANEFFFITHAQIEELGIEQEFCRPVMTSPQESRRLAVRSDDLPLHLFVCRKSIANLQGTAALEYIAYGEAKGYHQRASVRSRRHWYDLGDVSPAQLLMNKMIDVTSHTFWLEQPVYANNVLYEIHSTTSCLLKICVATNATVCQLFLNTEGRVNFGGGMLELAAYELSDLRIVSPTLLPEPESILLDSLNWDVMDPSPERCSIDEAVFDVLGLTSGERDGVYGAVVELVGNRKARARSV